MIIDSDEEDEEDKFEYDKNSKCRFEEEREYLKVTDDILDIIMRQQYGQDIFHSIGDLRHLKGERGKQCL